MAGAILLEKANHTAAARPSVEPCCERSCGRAVPCFEKPEPTEIVISNYDSPKDDMRRSNPPHIHVVTDGKVARVLVDSRGGFADTRVSDKLHLSTGSRMLKDGEIDAITLDKRTFVFGCKVTIKGQSRYEGGTKDEPCTEQASGEQHFYNAIEGIKTKNGRERLTLYIYIG